MSGPPYPPDFKSAHHPSSSPSPSPPSSSSSSSQKAETKETYMLVPDLNYCAAKAGTQGCHNILCLPSDFYSKYYK